MNAVAMLRGIKRKAVERFDGSIILKPSVPSLQALERVKADLTGYLIDDLNYPAEISLETAASAGRWKDSGNLLEGFAIIIVGPNEVLAPFHNRCPLILEPKDYDRWLAPAESSHLQRRFLILPAVCLENPQCCAALLLKQDEQLLHVLSAGSKVHGIDAEPSLALEFCRRNPEFAAPLDSLDHGGVQLLRIVFAQGGGAKADADGGHGWPAGGFEVRMLRNERIKMRRLADVVVDPVANLAAAVALKAHPDFEAPKPAGLLEEIRGLHAEGRGDASLVLFATSHAHRGGAPYHRARPSPALRGFAPFI